MSKPMSLAQQIRHAQQTVRKWSAYKRESVRLQGTVYYRMPEPPR